MIYMKNLNLIEAIIKYRSTIGIICLIVVLCFSEPTMLSIPIGFFIMLIGVFFRGWSSGYINKDNELATKGPYSLTRNPLYFGNFILGIGIAFAAHNIYAYIICFVFYFLFFPFLIIIENRRLKGKFGKEYETWSKNLNTFFPKIKRIKNSQFNISFYMKNREYKVFYFSLLIIAFFVIKYLIKLKN